MSRRSWRPGPYHFEEREPALPKTPASFKVWFAFCGVAALAFLAFMVWVVVTLVNLAVTRWG